MTDRYSSGGGYGPHKILGGNLRFYLEQRLANFDVILPTLKSKKFSQPNI